MKTKTMLLKKVSFLCYLLLLFIFNNELYSQIIYTDIPDTTPNATYPLDLNNDTIVDFLIQFDLSDKIMCKPQNSNAYSGNLVSGVHLPWSLPASTHICDTLATWYDGNYPGTMAWGTSIGNWVGVTDKYLALRLIVGTSTYYGWARLDVLATSTSFTIKDYAYESSPNTCILSGQTYSGLNEILNDNSFAIFPNPLITSTTIQTNGKLKNGRLTIYNSCGQALKQIINISGQSVSLYRDNLPSGLYLISLTDENILIAAKRIIITD